MTTQTKTIYELMQEVRNHPDYLFGTVFTVDDLDGWQTTSGFRNDRGDEAMAVAGRDYLDSHIRSGCECVSHDENDECVEVIA
jgi:hypothetical protein